MTEKQTFFKHPDIKSKRQRTRLPAIDIGISFSRHHVRNPWSHAESPEVATLPTGDSIIVTMIYGRWCIKSVDKSYGCTSSKAAGQTKTSQTAKKSKNEVFLEGIKSRFCGLGRVFSGVLTPLFWISKYECILKIVPPTRPIFKQHQATDPLAGGGRIF